MSGVDLEARVSELTAQLEVERDKVVTLETENKQLRRNCVDLQVSEG